MNVNLVTTSLSESFFEKNNFLLGKWCLFDKENYLKKKTNVSYIHKDIWLNSDKLQKDYDYSISLFNRIFPILYRTLNEKLGANKNDEFYWKILIGPWLIYFLQISINRWETLKSFTCNYEKIYTKILDFDSPTRPKNFYEFVSMFVSDTWNHKLFSCMIYFLSENENKNQFVIEKKKIKNNYNYVEKKRYKKNFTFPHNEKIFFYNSNFTFLDKIKMIYHLKKIPIFLEKINIDSEKEKEKIDFNLDFLTENNFEIFLKKNLLKFLPLYLYDNYESDWIKIKKLNLPKKINTIFSNVFTHDSVISRYFAEMKHIGSKLISFQHGGIYGQYRISTAEKLEIDLSDTFLTWGWNKVDNKKVKPFFYSKNIKKTNRQSREKIHFVLPNKPKYSYRIDSFSGIEKLENNYKKTLEIIESLDQNLKEKIILKDKKNFYSNYFKELIFNNYKKYIKYDEIEKYYSISRINIFPYLSTAYLESFLLNLPTIILYNEKDQILNKECLKYFSKLKRFNIVQDNPKSLADFINNNWKNIDDWWNDNELQKELNYFKKHYLNISENKILNIKNICK